MTDRQTETGRQTDRDMVALEQRLRREKGTATEKGLTVLPNAE